MQSHHSDDDDHHFGDHDEYGLDDDDDDDQVIELITHRRVAPSSGYMQVNTSDDDFDNRNYRRSRHNRNRNHNGKESHISRQLLKLQQLRKLLSREPPKGCAKCCAFFSCTGIVFLTILAFLIRYNAPYLRLSPEIIENKSDLLSSVVGAIFMYLGFFLVSIYIVFRSPAVRKEVEDGRFMH